MDGDEFSDFLVSLGIFGTFGFGISAVVSPPDPFTQIRILVVLAPLMLVGAYLLSNSVELT